MTKQNEIILEELRSIKQRLDDMDMNLEKDRERIQDLTIGLENVGSELKEVRGAINRNSETVRNKVAEVVEPVISSNDDLRQEIKLKKLIFVKDARRWWERIFIKK